VNGLGDGLAATVVVLAPPKGNTVVPPRVLDATLRLRFPSSGTNHILKVLIRLARLRALAAPEPVEPDKWRAKGGRGVSPAVGVAGDERRFTGALVLPFLLPEADPSMSTGGVPATGVVFVENALPLGVPTPLGVPAHGLAGASTSPPPDRFPGGGLFVNLLPPSLALPVLSRASSLPFSRSGSSDFFRPRTVCARCMMDMEPDRDLLLDVLSFSRRSFEDVEVDKLNADGGGDLVRNEVGESICTGGVIRPVYKGD
jgi:hypothetical protein